MEFHYYNEFGEYIGSAPAGSAEFPPRNAITIPPPDTPEGFRSKVNTDKTGWDLVRITDLQGVILIYEEVRPLFIRQIDEPVIYFSLFPYPDNPRNSRLQPYFKSLVSESAISQVGDWIVSGLRHGNELLTTIYKARNALAATTSVVDPKTQSTYQFSIFSLIHIVRNLLDLAITGFIINNFREEIVREGSIAPAAINELLHPKPDFKKRAEISVEKLAPNENTKHFLECVNEIANAYKHTIFNTDTMRYYGADVPTVLAQYVQFHKFREKKTRMHNHDLRQFVIGMNDFFDNMLSVRKI